ncbi:MAG: threonine/serine exporter family protein [Lachnospiraceae bacterium]
MIANLILPFLGTIAFSILFNVDRRFYFCCGLTGAMGWICYCFANQYATPAICSFLGTIVVVFLSRIFAVWKKCPITVFLISGIFPLVPGAAVYFTAYNLVTNHLTLAAEKGIGAMKIAFAIVIGIVFVISLPKKWFFISYWKQKKDESNTEIKVRR